MKNLFKFRFILSPLLVLFIVYFIIRLPNLTLQPIFADEAIYIRWAQVMRSEPTLRFLPLSDGKTPLFMWAMIPLFKFIHDPLAAGRFLSVLSGFFTLLGVTFLSWRFFNPKVALVSAFFLTFLPMFVFFDRMALVDSMLSAFCIWSLIFALLLMEYQRLDLSFILGYLLGGSLLTKPPGIFNIFVLPTTFLIFNWKSAQREKRLLKVFVLIVVAIITGLSIYNILRLGPGFSNLSSRNSDYVHSPTRLLQYPLDPFKPHLNDLLDWLPKFLTPFGFLLLVASMIYVIFSRKKLPLVILLWVIVPLIIQMQFLKTFTARYILFSIPPLICLMSFTLVSLLGKFKKNLPLLVLLGLILVFSLQFDLSLLTDPAKAPLPKTERRGYLEDWTAGYGLADIANYLTKEASNKRIIVGTEGYFGTLPDGLFIYLDKTPNISIVPGASTVSAQLLKAAKEHPTYFVINKSRFMGGERLELIKEYPKAKSPKYPQDAIMFFRVN